MSTSSSVWADIYHMYMSVVELLCLQVRRYGQIYTICTCQLLSCCVYKLVGFRIVCPCDLIERLFVAHKNTCPLLLL